MSITNTTAYYEIRTLQNRNVFIVQAPGLMMLERNTTLYPLKIRMLIVCLPQLATPTKSTNWQAQMEKAYSINFLVKGHLHSQKD